MGQQPEEECDLTSLHLQRACAGEELSLGWIVARFTPLLRIQAAYRLQGAMRRLFEVDDLVDEVWMIVLPRMGDLRARDGHHTPVLLKFLATTLLNRVNNHLTRHLRSTQRSLSDTSTSRRATGIRAAAIPGREPSITGAVARDEALGLLAGALDELDPDEREVLVLRGIEQHANQDVAARLGVDPSTATKRYHRVLERLRRRLPGSLFDELPS